MCGSVSLIHVDDVNSLRLGREKEGSLKGSIAPFFQK